MQRLGVTLGILNSLVKKNNTISTYMPGVMLGCYNDLDFLIASVQAFVAKLYIMKLLSVSSNCNFSCAVIFLEVTGRVRSCCFKITF